MLSAIQGAMASAIRQSAQRSPVTAKQEETTAPDGASQVSFSAAGLRQAAETAQAPDAMPNRFRLDGTKGAWLVRTDLTPAFKMPDDLVKEMAVRTEEEALREQIHVRHASEHRYQTVGQVMLNGQLVAEVDEAGGFKLVKGLSGLSDQTLSPQDRLKDIAGALAGSGQVEIKRGNFVQGLGGGSGPSAPQSLLPRFTARSLPEMFQAAREAMAQQVA